MQDNKLKLGVTRNWVYRIHMYLVFTGLISGFLIYKIGDVDSSKIWPLALGVSLSMLLPLIFGSIRNKSFKKGYLELVESNFHYGLGSYKASLISVNVYFLVVLLVIIWAVYQSF